MHFVHFFIHQQFDVNCFDPQIEFITSLCAAYFPKLFLHPYKANYMRIYWKINLISIISVESLMKTDYFPVLFIVVRLSLLISSVTPSVSLCGPWCP